MRERTVELDLNLPRQSTCSDCVDEVGRELGRVAGVRLVTTDPERGLLTVTIDEDALPAGDLELMTTRAGAQAHCAEHCFSAVHEHGQLDLTVPLPGEAGEQRLLLHVTGMDCADCAAKLQVALGNVRGISDASVSFGAATLAVSFDPQRIGPEGLHAAVRRLGYDTLEGRAARDAARAGSGPSPDIGASRARHSFWLRERRAQLTVASGVVLVAGFVAQAAAPAIAPWFFAAAMALGGVYVARAAFFSLRARQVEMNVLMTLAAVGAAAIGEWSEAGLVVFLFSLGNALQAATLERTRGAVSRLMDLSPPRVTVLRGGAEIVTSASEVAVDDIVLVRPGERMAVDGVVTEGYASANQAPITGEASPVSKGPGDAVFAGSIVEGGSLQVRAVTGVSDNTIAKIVHMVEEAQAKRAPMQTIVDRFAAHYTPVVVTLAVAVALLPVVIFGQPFGTWLYRGLAVLIIACPCALVISTPVSVLAALAHAARRGVLVKGGLFLEQAAKVKAIAFDKTGTLTLGRPMVTDVVALADLQSWEVLARAAALERASEHPLAGAIVAAAEAAASENTGRDACAGGCVCEQGSPARGQSVRVRHFRALAGRGVQGEIDGRVYFVGRPDLVVHDASPRLRAEVERLQRDGKTVIVLGDEDGPLGVIAVRDPLRPGAADVVARLRRQGVERVTMLTGDNAATAAAIAGEAAITDVRSRLMPADKLAAAIDLRDRHAKLMMVGDGVNDAPALAAATVGVAMGAAGTDAALETADIVLLGDDLQAIPDTIALARRMTRVIWQNIAFAIAVKALFLVLAPFGLVTLWMAVFADMGTSLLVIGNGMRLLRHERRRRSGMGASATTPQTGEQA